MNLTVALQQMGKEPTSRIRYWSRWPKTGHTNEAGYGLVGSAKQDGRRIIFVLSGLQTLEDRAQEAGQ